MRSARNQPRVARSKVAFADRQTLWRFQSLDSTTALAHRICEMLAYRRTAIRNRRLPVLAWRSQERPDSTAATHPAG
jgi:hypothetical protein